MPRVMIFGAVLSALLAAATPADADPACALIGTPTILHEEGDPNALGSRLFKVWEVPDDAVLWSPADPVDGAYGQFVSEVEARRIETDPIALLEKSPTANNRLVLENAEDWIVEATCIEKILYGIQHGRLDTFENPSEFGGFILRSPDRTMLRVYFVTVNQDWLGNMDDIVGHASRDRDQGWEFMVAMHSHVFHPGQPELNGLLAPSEPDAAFHIHLLEEMDLREAWINNGIDTVRMPALSLGDFSTKR